MKLYSAIDARKQSKQESLKMNAQLERWFVRFYCIREKIY